MACDIFTRGRPRNALSTGKNTAGRTRNLAATPGSPSALRCRARREKFTIRPLPDYRPVT